VDLVLSGHESSFVVFACLSVRALTVTFFPEKNDRSILGVRSRIRTGEFVSSGTSQTLYQPIVISFNFSFALFRNAILAQPRRRLNTGSTRRPSSTFHQEGIPMHNIELIQHSQRHVPVLSQQHIRQENSREHALANGCRSPLSLSARVLETPEERMAIADLRRYAPSGVEDDLGLQMSHLESVRDEMAVVTAIERNQQAIGTLRFVPSGHNLTGGERLMRIHNVTLPLHEPGSWEVGRLIVSRDERNPQMLSNCLAMALDELTRLHEVNQFFAIATPAMARLWRRFGLNVVMNLHGASGAPFVLVLGQATDVARILH
jgi:predicted GNAT family N-acyltransferase